MGWGGEEILSMLQVGGVYQSGTTPKICVFNRNSATAIEHAAEVEAKESGGEAEGFVRRPKHCTAIPVVWRQVDLVPKGLKWRVAIDRSGPRDRSVWIGGVAYPVSPNANTSKADVAELE